MTRPEGIALWARAKDAFASAEILADSDWDATASRAYYAAFYAVSAWFALADRRFKKHSAVRAAVNEDLVHSGAWDPALAKAYSFLSNLRSTADYGVETRVAKDEAEKAVKAARTILEAVAKLKPEDFSL